ncbi:MAG TPA: thiamine pyrophosphate-dependent dehydrogenase E1 component subunit alpha [Thermoplasmata archaeon]|nr:thiamine pyrophosphate-dependent dehydrogenase E1 component subunit alpha [Thermoplasmata archaeon]HTW77395.1 thiamine pyrophosphate-dependent dehydrogenase E1 component subunit alpha [Thermoplasmata archaeon]
MAESTASTGTPPRAPASASTLTTAEVVAAYRWMVLARVTDERCLSLQRQGRIGFYAPLQGQEAAQVGIATALRPEDWVFPAYRELAVALTRGVDLQEVVDQLYGNAADLIKGRQMPNHFGFREQHFVVASSPIGTQITQAVGAAMAARRRGDAIVTASFFGDGATSSNDFHAGLNFAGVFRVPTIFFCQNNQWAISLPREKQTRSATLAEKASAYGFPGVVVDGNDLRAVVRVVAEARERAVTGGGPTLIEAQVYRFGPHSTSDDPKRYRSEAELEAAKKRDPVLGLQHELRANGVLTEAADAQIWDEAKARLAHAIEVAEQRPPVAPTSFLEDVFARPTPRLEEERATLERLLAAGTVRP